MHSRTHYRIECAFLTLAALLLPSTIVVVAGHGVLVVGMAVWEGWLPVSELSWPPGLGQVLACGSLVLPARRWLPIINSLGLLMVAAACLGFVVLSGGRAVSVISALPTFAIVSMAILLHLRWAIRSKHQPHGFPVVSARKTFD